MLSLVVSCRYSLLCLYGNARCVLHKRHQHPRWNQRHRVRPGFVHIRLHHHLQPAGAWRYLLDHFSHWTFQDSKCVDVFVFLFFKYWYVEHMVYVILIFAFFLTYQEITGMTMFSPSTSWYHSFSPHWHFFTTTGKLYRHLRGELLILRLIHWPSRFVAGTLRLRSSETLFVTLRGWPSPSSASWDISVKQCCCSFCHKWLTLSTLFHNCFISYPVRDTASPGNSMSIRPWAHTEFRCLSWFFFFLNDAPKYFVSLGLPRTNVTPDTKAESRHRQTGVELL